MKNLIRRWNIALRRRRLALERREIGRYQKIEDEKVEAGQTCMNCKVPLTGPFCHICGQKDDDLRRPIWTFFRELLDNIVSVDSRMFKSLILLVLVPGGLTRAYLMGRRARFVPPLRLYLITSISFFLIIKAFDVLILDIKVSPNPVRAQQVQEVMENLDVPDLDTVAPEDRLAAQRALAKEISRGLAEIKAREAAGELSPEDATVAEEAVRQVIGQLVPGEETQTETDLASPQREGDGTDQPSQVDQPVPAQDDDRLRLSFTSGNDEEPGLNEEDDEDGVNIDLGDYSVELAMFVEDTGEEHAGLRQSDIDEILQDDSVPNLIKDAAVGFSKALRNPQEFNELFNDWLPIALFALMPFFALILRLFHWRKEQVYMHQLVFSLHFHSFLFLMFMALIIIVPRYGGEVGITLFWWGASAYLWIALKVGQSQGWIKSFFKGGLIWFSYLIVMMPVLAFVVVRGLSEI